MSTEGMKRAQAVLGGTLRFEEKPPPRQNYGGCWTCEYHRNVGETLLGECHYFVKMGRPAKDVPPEVIDLGCKFRKEREPRKVEAAGSI